MALSCMKARVMHSTGFRAQRLARCVVRVQASSSTDVKFKLHRHVEFGQSLLLVGSIPELGSWDAKQALELQWGEGDNWTASAAIPFGAGIEYKYIIKRRDGLDWCPGQNKSVTLPSAASVEVTDSWDNPLSNVALLTPLETAAATAVEAPAAPVEAEAPALIVAEVPLPIEGNGVSSADVLTVTVADGPELESISAVSTVENLHVAELESGAAAAAAQPSHLPAPTSPSPSPGGFLANNIVQGVPMGAVAVGSDPITQYEEADKYQVVEVGSANKASAVATETRAASAAATTAAASKALDKMTMAELRTEVKRRGMSPLGNRRELLTRLQNAGVV